MVVVVVDVVVVEVVDGAVDDRVGGRFAAIVPARSSEKGDGEKQRNAGKEAAHAGTLAPGVGRPQYCRRMKFRRFGLAILAALSSIVAACSDDPDASTPPPSSTSTTTSTTLSNATVAPTSAQPADDDETFDIPEPPADVNPCSPSTDLSTHGGYVDAGEDLDVDALFVINISDGTCGLNDPGFVIGGEPVPVGEGHDPQSASAVLGSGEHAVFLVTSPRPDGSDRFDPDAIGDVRFGLAGDHRTQSDFAKYVDGVSFVGPVEWSGPPNSPPVFVPADPAAGVPITEDDLVTTAGVGAFRAGMSPQEVADATGTVFVAIEWNVASPGCGYGWLPPFLEVTISSPTDSLDDASVGAVSRAGDLQTPSGLGIGTSVDELRDALGDDRLSTRPNEYSGADDYLFTPRSPDEQHLGMFFRIDPETLTVSSFEAGLMTQIGRGEGCA